MLILAIDTASRWTAIALYNADSHETLAEKGWTATLRQTVELAPAIAELFEECALYPADLGGISVAIGPGSYTGLRIGLGLAKGLALVHQIPIVGIKTHDIVADRAPTYLKSLKRLVVAVEAGRKRALLAPYKWESDVWVEDGDIYNPTWPEFLESLDEEIILSGEIPDEVADTLKESYPMVQVAPIEHRSRSAATLAKLGAAKILTGELLANDELVPEYLRAP